ncbi:putative pyridoxal phosphate-dependent deaminase [Actinokineospora spheciospongiae]|uniref:Putative pyridoxal phosphate-dependent deaminase n=1 Tax=Actinokineospora spheciospongiae TaxID=909613 RepID=W7JCL6_9PSEU|nr:D-cysteine desulfhydrase family protein [Actinokineospora spheciospongiae]EWC63764.1 putative pyridoxal phosphate-dependent deaminase [Actinokineospora spheciospongiae]PWW58292.1 D-cysteine desulfhydrase [Actinokineospora spheciospongiae]
MTIDLSAFPRVALGHWPTPLDECPRLGAELGIQLLLKRDDVGGVGAGGNKLRKLEFLLGAALDRGADTVITFGAVQTNHGRQTAAACARLGLRCELVLTRSVARTGQAYEESGNIVLDHLYGANVHLCADAEETAAVYNRLLAEAEAQGRTVATFPVGGSDEVGVLGYVAATVELFQQVDSLGLDVGTLVVPVGSAGTAAGVALGAELLCRTTRVEAACVSHTAEESRADITRLAGAAAGLLGAAEPALPELVVDDRAVGPAYGVPTEEMWRALELFARTEGVTLDPVYTGKAAACLVDRVRTGEIAPGETVVFLHTGGLPGLFAYAPDLLARAGS